jgi:hypothetical protein
MTSEVVVVPAGTRVMYKEAWRGRGRSFGSALRVTSEASQKQRCDRWLIRPIPYVSRPTSWPD